MCSGTASQLGGGQGLAPAEAIRLCGGGETVETMMPTSDGKECTVWTTGLSRL